MSTVHPTGLRDAQLPHLRPVLSAVHSESGTALKWRRGIAGKRVISVFGSARTPSTEPEYELAKELGAAIAQRRWLAMTGGGPGIMQAVRDGSGAEASLAVRIEIPGEVPDTVLGPEQSITVSTFALRKALLTHDVDGFVFLPGGVGTLDELTEVLVLQDTGKIPPAPSVLLEPSGSSYWQPWLDFMMRSVVARGLVGAELFDSVVACNHAEQAVDHLDSALMLRTPGPAA